MQNIASLSLNKPALILGILLLLVITISPSFYFYNKYQNTLKSLQSPQTESKEEVKVLADKVGKIYKLPESEEPTIATVTDLEKLKGQAFFANAKIGDKVLIYSQAKKAILYDPVANKVIEVGPLIIPSSSPSVSSTLSNNPPIMLSITPTVTLSSSLKVFLYNGTSTVGLTGKIETLLKGKLNNVEIVDRDNAQKKDYAKTLVIDLTGKKRDEAASLAKLVGAEISTLPAGENKPAGADFLIIVGTDKK